MDNRKNRSVSSPIRETTPQADVYSNVPGDVSDCLFAVVPKISLCGVCFFGKYLLPAGVGPRLDQLVGKEID